MTIKDMRNELIIIGLAVEEWSDDKIAAYYPKFMLPWSEKVKALEIRNFPLHEMSIETQERMYYRVVAMDWPEDQKAYGRNRHNAFREKHKDIDKDSAQNEARKYSKMEKVKLLSFGGLGIGATIYRLNDGRVIKVTISGGMLDEEEDPIIVYEDFYDNFEAWFEGFKENSGYNWIRSAPDYIHADVRDYLKEEVDNYVNDSGYPIYGRQDWYYALNSVQEI